jgi:hypothetical protein
MHPFSNKELTMKQRDGVGLAAVVCALAGLCAPASAGPDITHQEIQDAGRYGTTAGAPINGKYGYAWGSYTCNIGDTGLAWINGGTPALAMNAYRLHGGRLVQIGLGNAKHSCCVGNGAGCGTCTTTGTGLRPGCRDIYSAGFNSGQTRLGPRSGINPYAATFSSIPAGSGDALFRRVQVDLTDMSLATYPGAQYFAEGVYVCAAEQPAQQLNNATYRPMLVANAGATPTYIWSVTGTTQSGTPAIFAWRDSGLGPGVPDPSVVIATVDVPSEGRYFVGGKATDLGGGQWRYDYAVFNLNSHQSGAGFSVPVHPSATITDVGFSAPDYHSGEVYSNTDWVSSRCSSRLSWKSPETFAQNPNTSALRWGTMYNFWFTSNQAPLAEGGPATIAMFRPGAASEIVADRVPIPAGSGCTADFNAANGVSTQDLFDFLGAWFAIDPRADFNCTAGVSVQDVFDFVAAWFSGCA